MASAKGKGYFGFGWIVSLILAIIPVTNIILGLLIRLQNKKYLLAILNILIAPVFYIVDLVSIILNKQLKYLL